ncbi:MAG: porin family protein [Gemmatimonadaceae bacterium]
MRIRPLGSAIAIAISCATIPSTASAQSIGTLIGANIASISNIGEGVSDVTGGLFNSKKRIGLKGGFFLKIPIAGMVSLEPELLYAQNGVRVESTVSGDESFDVDLGYVEIPVLMRIDVARTKHLHPILMAGGSAAYRVQCKFGASSSGSTVAQDCGATGGADDPFKKNDYSVVGGAGLAAGLGGFGASLQVRYSQGVSNIAKDDLDTTNKPKNKAFSVLLGFIF